MKGAGEEPDVVLRVRNLGVSFQSGRGKAVTPVQDVSFHLRRGEMLGLVGESGCGKSLTARAVLGLVGRRRGQRVRGEVRFHGDDLLRMNGRALRRLLGHRLAMVLQDPMTSLNPVYRVGNQIAEVPRLHEGATRRAARARAVSMLREVGIEHAENRAFSYPHEFSGGMRQRAAIAMALICRPEVLIADEPTTALDVTVQAGILKLMSALREEYGAGVLFITHDLSVVAETCDRVLVMYAGRIVEEAGVQGLFKAPTHPYTEALLASVPTLDTAGRLEPIAGRPPDPEHMPPGCPFEPRCPLATDRCRREMPPLAGPGRHRAACWVREAPDA